MQYLLLLLFVDHSKRLLRLILIQCWKNEDTAVVCNWQIRPYNCSISSIFFYYRLRFTTITPPGATTKPLTFLEGRLGLTTMKRSFPPTGTHPSPRSASVWRSVSRSGLLSSTSRRTPCTLWSLMGNTAAPHWAVTRGCRWLVLVPPCSAIVTEKDLTPRVTVKTLLMRESASLVTIKTIALPVTPESGLVLEEKKRTPTHVGT